MPARGPLTFTDDGNWRADAACKTRNTDDFYPERGDTFDDIRELCAGCPVRERCLEEGLANRELGVWGGTSERERRQILRERRAAGILPPRVKPRPPCGTDRGYSWHLTHGGASTACIACNDAHRRAALLSDDRVDPSYRYQCGSNAGWMAHYRAIPQERPCLPCASAHRAYQRNKKQQTA